MDPFESILSIIYSVFYCVRYTQGMLIIRSSILAFEEKHDTGVSMELTGLYVHSSNGL